MMVSPSWRHVLLNHLNAQHGISLTEDVVDFVRYHFQPSLVKRNTIVVPKDEKMFNRSMVTYEPYKPSKYFLKVPTVFFVGQSITNGQVIDLLNETFGVTFDKDVDFEPGTLSVNHLLTEFPKVVTIPVAEKTSFIWTDSVTVTLHDANTLFNELIKVRDLDALAYNDTEVDDKASVWLTTWPYKVTGIALLREFSRSPSVLLRDEILDELLDELVAQRIINVVIRPEFRAMLDGQTITFTDIEGTDYNRQGVSILLESEHYSGKLVIRLNKEDTFPIGDVVDSPIQLTEIVNDGGFDDRVALLKLSINHVTEPGIVSVLSARHQQRPELEDIPFAIESMGKNESTVERIVTDTTNWVESVTINVGMSADSTYYGSFGIVSKTPDFTVDAEEDGLPIQAEDATDIQLEHRFVALTLAHEPTLIINPEWINLVPLGHIPVVGTLLYEGFNSATSQYVLSPTLVATPVADGTVYTNALISGLELRINHPVVKGQLSELFGISKMDGYSL